MSSPSGPAEQARAPVSPTPAPPGGHALRITPVPTPAQAVRVDEISAGGLVVTEQGGVAQGAIIARRNRAGRLEWCLPKGHLEGDETPEQAAVREIAEETGITGQVVARLGVIDYWFGGDERRVHKVVHHYLMAATGGELSKEHDPDQEVEAVEWVPLDELDGWLSYPNERRLAAVALTTWSAGPAPT
jgi:8-oxo-dGTP pyrophosphatase MutT (NUDIX family)